MDVTRLNAPRRLRFPAAPDRGGGEMAALDFGDPDRPFDLIFLHANGFNALTYRFLLAPLSASLRILAPDLRGHGRSSLPADPVGRTDWRDHRDDLTGLLDAIGGPPVAVAGHSMGATCAILAAAERPGAVSNLLLIDPVLWPRPVVMAFKLPLLRRLPERMPLVPAARRRRAVFPDRAAAVDSYRGRGAFRGWPDAALADYAADGLRDRPGGQVELACAPDWEASNYISQSHDPWRALARYDRPVRILKAARNSTCFLKTASARLPRVTVVEVPDSTHFMPMLQPGLVRDALFEAAGGGEARTEESV